MKKLILFALILSALMFAEYRYIMNHISPTVQVDVYDFE